jgi:hypothetical protein
MMEYAEHVKARMVRRMLGPNAVTATNLANESGIPQPTLSRWLRGTATLTGVSRPKPPKRPAAAAPAPSPSPKRPQDWTALERAAVVLRAAALGADEVGEFLREQGLHREHLVEWRVALETALAEGGERRPSKEAKRIKELERDLARKDKALAETAALLVLKKKMDLLWAAEDDDTDKRSDK